MNRTPYVVVAVAYVLTCLALWPWPLLGLLHAESSAVVAGVGFFASGLGALALFRRGAAPGPVLGRMLLLLAVPLALLTLSLVWRPNCGYALGLGLFALFAVPSVGLAVALAWALDATGWRWLKTWLALVGLGVALVPVAWDLGLHPQFYTYNHVWGGVLGPIYDEELALRAGLFWFRGLTVLWTLALFLLAGWMRGTRRGWSWLFVGLTIAGVYALGPRLGINTNEAGLQAALGSHRATEHFDIYYDDAAVSSGELGVIEDVTAYRYAVMRDHLGVEVGERIALYLYPGAETKAALTGAGRTSVAPVWLATPQTHLLLSRFDASFAHELAHVFSREFGGLFNATPAVGLVEGLAVALEPPDGLPTPDAQVAAAARARATEDVYVGTLAEAVASRLTPLGFWTGRGAVSYTTAGSFVRFLLDSYGPEPFRAAYASGDLAAAYGQPLDSLASAWERHVLALPEDAEAEALVAFRFTQPSLFEKSCPHWVPPWRRALRAGYAALESGDGTQAYQRFAEAVQLAPHQPAALAAWGRLALARDEADVVVQRLGTASEQARSAAVWSRLRDAYALSGEARRAQAALDSALAVLPAYGHASRAALLIKAQLSNEALRTLLGPEPAAARAAALAGFDEPAASVFAGQLWTEADAFDRAVAAFEAAAGQVPDEAEAVWLGWLARAAHAAGDRATAAAYFDQAAATYETAGANAAAERERDRAALLWSFLLTDDPVLRSEGGDP